MIGSLKETLLSAMALHRLSPTPQFSCNWAISFGSLSWKHSITTSSSPLLLP